MATDSAAALDRLRAMSREALLGAADQVEAWSASTRDVQFRARLNAYRDILEFERTGDAPGHSRSSTEAALELNELMGFSRRYDVGKVVLQKYVERFPGAANLRKQAVVMSGYTTTATPFVDDFNNDLQIVSKPGAKTTVLVFCGIRHLFGFSLNLLHHCWLGAHDANIIYIRDHHETLYMQGIKSIGDQAASVAFLRGAVQALGAPKLVSIGNSGGVLGALHYGSLLDADAILGYSGPSSVDIGLQFEVKQSFKRLAKLQAAGKVTWPDVRAALHARPGTKVRMFYAGEHEADRPQAENLAGLPNVSLEPVPGETEHFIIDKLIESGTFGSSLSDAIDTAPEPVAQSARDAARKAPIVPVPNADGEEAPAPAAPATAAAPQDAPTPAAAAPAELRMGRRKAARLAARAADATPPAAAVAPTLVATPPRNAKGHEASRRREEHFADSRPDVLILGDSRAAMWPKEISAVLGTSVANLGIPTSTVPVMAWKIGNTAVDLDATQHAFVIAGINDLRMTEETPEAVAQSIAELASMIRGKAPKAAVHVFEIFAAKEERHHTEAKRAAANRRLHELAQGGGFHVVRTELNDPTDEALFKEDGLHLRPKAYRRLTRTASEHLARQPQSAQTAARAAQG